MRLRFPLLIGISGKRKFDASDADRDREISARVAERFRTIFRQLDCDFPETPKIVLTGAAFGADLIAAQVAYGMGTPNWAVAAILPFSPALFEEDFVAPTDETPGRNWADRYREHAISFAGLLNLAAKENPAHPRLIVRQLPPLRVGDRPATDQELLRASADRTLRRKHYEQVGQFIAESATIMIAVMDSNEEPTTDKADGGTARVVAYSREGRPDIVGAAVASDSRVLRRRWSALLRPPGGFVWILDPERADEARLTRCGGAYPVIVLPPQIAYAQQASADNRPRSELTEHEPEHHGPLWRLAQWSKSDAKRATESERKLLRASLSLAKGLDRFNARFAPSYLSASEKFVEMKELADVAREIAGARDVVREHQTSAKKWSERGFKFLATAFVAALFVFEVFAKFAAHEWPPLLAYVLILVAIGFMAFMARAGKWQPISEDYRAVSEMLRVQRTWLFAGLTDRVDREHLEGADYDLARVRDATKTIIVWLLLRRGWTKEEPTRWAEVRGTETTPRGIDRKKKTGPGDWIGSQIHYFKKYAAQREETAHRADAASWTVFVASWCLAAILCAALAWHPLLSKLEPFSAPFALCGCLNGGPVANALFWLVATGGLIWFRVWNGDLKRYLPAATCTLAVALLAALCLTLAILSAVPLLNWLLVFFAQSTEHAAEHAMVLVLVTLSAFAGAWRYLTERLNVEAEALEYRDARGRFERAEHLLCPGANSTSGTPADPNAARELVLDLGRLALTENEAWLKSRRERPLTPVVG